MPARAIEFALVFFALPTLFAFTRHRIPAIPALWALTAWCLVELVRDPGFHRARLWNPAPLPGALPSILLLFAIGVGIATVAILRCKPEIFLSLPRKNPALWGLIMIAYPVLSVYPQGIVFRAFIFERYRDLFRADWAIVLASALAFSYIHIVFRNSLALALTLPGGFLFALRYLQTGSLFVSSFEHALYGCGIFTIGIGRSFYHATNRNLASL